MNEFNSCFRLVPFPVLFPVQILVSFWDSVSGLGLVPHHAPASILGYCSLSLSDDGSLVGLDPDEERLTFTARRSPVRESPHHRWRLVPQRLSIFPGAHVLMASSSCKAKRYLGSGPPQGGSARSCQGRAERYHRCTVDEGPTTWSKGFTAPPTKMNGFVLPCSMMMSLLN